MELAQLHSAVLHVFPSVGHHLIAAYIGLASAVCYLAARR